MDHTLLLADDSITIQRVVELTFVEQGVRVVAVGDGEEATRRLRQEPPDIVLAAINLPTVDGYEVAAFMQSRKELRHVPILLMSGAFDSIDEARVRESGAAGVLVKPFEPQLVINRVKELLGITAKPAARPVGGAPPLSGRPVTSDDPPRAARPPMHEPASFAPSPPPAPVTEVATAEVTPAIERPDEPDRSTEVATPDWDHLRKQQGSGQAAPTVEADAGGSEDYFEQLDAAFDTLDAQLSRGRGSPASRSSGPLLLPRMPAAIDPGRRPSALGNQARISEAKPEKPVFEVDSDWFGSAEAAANAADAASVHDSEGAETAASAEIEASQVDVTAERVDLAPLYEAPTADAISSFDYLTPPVQADPESAPWAAAPSAPAPWAPAPVASWAPAPVAPAPVAPAPAASWVPAPVTAAAPAPSAVSAYGSNESAVADAFAALLAEEQGEPLPVLPEDPNAAFDLSEAAIDRIAARVVDRLTHGVMGETVMRVVSEVSERLVRDEIVRIRSLGTQPPE
ncbi:MAG TPA: response regulator [Vicinamibacterales bacterium]|nr:response regulator [Vicinamibacterales bacterium]